MTNNVTYLPLTVVNIVQGRIFILMKINRNKLKFALIFLIAGSLLGAAITYAVVPTTAFTISSGIYPGAPSYTIWREGSNYFAKDSNGLIPTWGSETDAYIIGQKAINNAPTGGLILWKAATYELDPSAESMPYDALQVNKTVNMQGEGMGTILKATGSWRWSIILISADDCTISNFYIDGNMRTTGNHGVIGIYINNAENTIIQNTWINDTAYCAIQITGTSQNTKILNNHVTNISNSTISDPAIRCEWLTSDNLIQGNTVINGYESGIRTYISGSTRTKRTRIINNYVKGYGILGGIHSNGEGETIANNILEYTGHNDSGAIVLHRSKDCSITGNVVRNCRGTGIRLDNTNYSSVTGNNVRNTTRSGIVFYASQNCTSSSNTISYITTSNQAGIYIFGDASVNSTNIAVTGNTLTHIFIGTWESVYTDYNSVIGNIITDITAGSPLTNGIRREAGVGTHSIGNNSTDNLVY